MGENPCTLKNGDRKAPLPPKPTPTIPSSETMCLLSRVSEVRCVASREVVVDVNRAVTVGVVIASIVNLRIALVSRATHCRRDRRGALLPHGANNHAQVG